MATNTQVRAYCKQIAALCEENAKLKFIVFHVLAEHPDEYQDGCEECDEGRRIAQSDPPFAAAALKPKEGRDE